MEGAVVEAKCPSCRQSTSADAGEPTPAHQKPDSRETCPGGTAT